MSRTAPALTAPPSISAWAIAWSRIDSPSRADPSAARAISPSASGSASTPSAATTRAKCSASNSAGMRRKSKRWQRDSTVTGTLLTSVVASTNFTPSAGSSSVFSSALKAFFDSMWTSSMM
ncbi:hypothetical protein D9M73_133570 [compost metagenome]